MRWQTRHAGEMSVSERVAALSHHVRSLIADRRLAQKSPDDAYLGLYVGDDEADRLAGQNGEALERSRYNAFTTAQSPQSGLPAGNDVLVGPEAERKWDPSASKSPDSGQRFKSLSLSSVVSGESGYRRRQIYW